MTVSTSVPLKPGFVAVLEIDRPPQGLAARFLEPDILRVLQAGGADPKLTMRDGATALMLAAGLGSSTTQDRRGVALIVGVQQYGDECVVPERRHLTSR